MNVKREKSSCASLQNLEAKERAKPGRICS
jgi:hypothetical protein